MKRWFVRVISVLSLILLAPTLWMWFRSYWFDDQFQRTVVGTISTSEGKFDSNRLLWICSSDGKLALMTVDKTWPLTRRDDRPVMQWWWSEDITHLKNVEQRYGNWKRFNGFGFGSFQGTLVAPLASPTGRISSRCVIMRWPLLAALFTIAPIWWAYLAFREKEREERTIRGLCRHCGYDLRGAGGICPECGKGGGKDAGSMQKVI